MSWLLRAVLLKQVLFCFTGEASSHSSKQTVHSDRWEENYFSSIKSYENCFSRWVLLPNYDKRGIQQLRGQNSTNFWPPPPHTHTLSSGQKLTFYKLSTLYLVIPVDFLLTPTPLFLSTYVPSYWMPPNRNFSFRLASLD